MTDMKAPAEEFPLTFPALFSSTRRILNQLSLNYCCVEGNQYGCQSGDQRIGGAKHHSLHFFTERLQGSLDDEIVATSRLPTKHQRQWTHS